MWWSEHYTNANMMTGNNEVINPQILCVDIFPDQMLCGGLSVKKLFREIFKKKVLQKFGFKPNILDPPLCANFGR